MTLVILFLSAIITGCVTKSIPMPAPIPCEIRIKGECREQSASERGGAVVRGHGEEVKDVKP